MKKIMTSISLLTALFPLSTFAQSPLTIGSTTVMVDTVYNGLTVPWEIQYGSDDHLWVTERSGIVSRIHPTNQTKTVVLNITSSVYLGAENGLLGFAFHPDFPTTPEVFLAYTYDQSNPKEKIVKYTYNGTNLVNENVLIDNISAGETHCGARLAFLSDGTLLVTTGDAQDQSTPQNANSLNGKILRLNTDGSIPANNPNPASYVYTLGHRNPQGLLVMPNGTVYISEHGAVTDDEFQVVEAGRNYGWPDVEGFCDEAGETAFCTANNVKEPMTVWTPTIAPSDIVYYQNAQFPEWNERILMTVLKNKRIIAMQLNGAGDDVVDEDHYLVNQFGRLRDICIGPNKEIYIATNGQNWGNTGSDHRIIVLYPPGSTGLNPVTTHHLSVYPNPVGDQFTVTLPQGMNSGSIVLTDVNGKLLSHQDVNGNPSLTLAATALPNGVYFISFLSEGSVVARHKLIK